MDLARLGNKYLADTEPWKLFKHSESRERTETILNISIQLTSTLAILCEPFMPFTSQKILALLNMDSANWSDAGDMNLVPNGTKLNPPKLLFSIIEDDQMTSQVDKLKKSKKENLL